MKRRKTRSTKTVPRVHRVVIHNSSESDLGVIEGRTSNMYGGKTGWLIGIACDPTNQREGLGYYQPVMTVRNAGLRIARSQTHATYRKAIPVRTPKDILRHVVKHGIRHVCIDEVHFFERTKKMAAQFKDLIRTLLRMGVHIYWVGLPLDYRGEPFELVAWMMAKTDEFDAFPGKCCMCHGSPAHYSQRLMFGHPAPVSTPRFVPDTPRYQRLGFTYEARCGKCWVPPPRRPNIHLRRILAQLRAESDSKKQVHQRRRREA